MGKRELLLVLGFVIVGTLVYQITAPAAAPGQQGFSIGRLVDHIRRQVRSNHSSQEVSSTQTIPLKPGTTELRIILRAESLTITGEDREDIAADLVVRSTGVDDEEAKRLATATVLKLEESGARLAVDIDYPVDGRQYGKLVLKVPSRLRVSVPRYSGNLNVTGMAEVELVDTRGEAIVREVQGRLTASHNGGELTVADAPGGRITVRGTDARLTRITGDMTVQAMGGEVIVSDLLGGIELNANGTDVTCEKLENAQGQIRLTATNGNIKLTGVKTDTRVDGRNAEITLAMAAPAEVSIYNEGDEPIDFVPPRWGGYQLDAVATDGGRIVLPDGYLSVASEKDEQRASGEIGGGGPTVTLRASRGEIVVRSPKSESDDASREKGEREKKAGKPVLEKSLKPVR